jgi:dTDP-L-rhamnose 4-epimerase
VVAVGERVLITGGAGFIGSYAGEKLLAAGYEVRALDNLTPQVHGPVPKRPEYLDPDIELYVGDVRDRAAVESALDNVDVVVHLAAAVGVGQSMYEISHYTDVNARGTAVLLEAMLERPIRRLIVASSMSIYGEGMYRRADGTLLPGGDRSIEQLQRGQWELLDNEGGLLEPVPTSEAKPPTLSSIYAMNKYDQERLCLIFGRTYDVPTVALRFFNVYGPRQALSNPYTGVMAIFASRLLNGNRPLIFEDGEQKRDFVSVHDIANACRLAVDASAEITGTLNIGSGRAVSIRELAERACVALGRSDIAPEVTGKYRAGDIRHCFSDITLAREALGYEPRVTLESGMDELAGWLVGQQPEDRAGQATQELVARGLAI